jgi:hypothetical protein
MRAFNQQMIIETYDAFESNRKWIFVNEKIDRVKYALNSPVRVIGGLPGSNLRTKSNQLKRNDNE